MFMDVIQKFIVYVQKHGLLSRGEKVLVAVSGGIDSVVLLHLLRQLQPSWQLTLSVAHLNHGLRGASADRDEAFVKTLAEELKLPFYSKKADVKAYVKKHGLSLEEGARDVRFAFLMSLLKTLEYDKLALGHHANDQAETILMNIVRGSGLRGCQGMHPLRGAVIRPLLFAMKHEIEAYAKQHKLSYVVDESNSDRRFLRNRIRWDVLPVLERAAGAHAISCICRTGAISAEAEAYISDSARKAKKRIVRKGTRGEIILDIDKFLSYFKAVQKILLFQILEEELQLKKISASKIDRLLSLAEKGKSGHRTWLDKEVTGIRSGHHLVFTKQTKPLPEIPVRVGRPVDILGQDARFHATLMELDGRKDVFTEERTVEYLDYDTVSFPLRIRYFRHGDAFYPLGMGAKKKLHDFFIDEKVPNYQRMSVPLLLGGDDILWVVGYRIDDRFKVTDRTKKIMKIAVYPK